MLNANYSSVFDVVFSPLSRLLLYSFLGLYGFIGCCRVGLGRIDYLVWGVWVVLFRSYVFFLSIHALYFFSSGGYFGFFGFFVI